MTEANKHIVRRLMKELFSAGQLSIADELIAEDYVEHSPLPGQEPGLGGLKHALTRFWVAFPDFNLSIEDLIAEGDRVVVRSIATATHLGAFFGVPPTGLRVRWTAIDIIRLADGKQAEHWGNQETLEVLHQLNHLGAHTVDQTLTQTEERRNGAPPATDAVTGSPMVPLASVALSVRANPSNESGPGDGRPGSRGASPSR